VAPQAQFKKWVTARLPFQDGGKIRQTIGTLLNEIESELDSENGDLDED
jgi:hypothetical protein